MSVLRVGYGGECERFIASAELRSAMQQAGVAEQPEIYIAEEIASGKT